MIESDELMKKKINIDRDSISLEEQKIIFNEPAEEISSEFKNLEKKLTLITWFVSTKLKE